MQAHTVSVRANQDKPAGYEAILASAGPGRPPRSHHQRPLHQYAGNVMTDVLPGGLNTTEVREWAKAQGINAKDRGRVPAELVVKFKAATSQ